MKTTSGIQQKTELKTKKKKTSENVDLLCPKRELLLWLGGFPDLHTHGEGWASTWTSPGTVGQTQYTQSVFSCQIPRQVSQEDWAEPPWAVYQHHPASPPFRPTPIHWSKNLISFKTWRWTLPWWNCPKILDPAFNTDTEWGGDSHTYPKCREFCSKLDLASSINGCQSMRKGWMALLLKETKVSIANSKF